MQYWYNIDVFETNGCITILQMTTQFGAGLYSGYERLFAALITRLPGFKSSVASFLSTRNLNNAAMTRDTELRIPERERLRVLWDHTRSDRDEITFVTLRDLEN